jgi:hypothetical protein
MHGADYANEEVIGKKGILGRSYGCPAVPQKYTREIIDTSKKVTVYLYIIQIQTI